MAKQTKRRVQRKKKGTAARGDEPRGGRRSFEHEPAAESTNTQRRGRAGERASVPGAGIVRSGADAGPAKARAGEPEQQNYPGKRAAHPTKRAPGARRPGTTRSGVSSTPTSRGGSDVRDLSEHNATETVTGGDSEAPLSAPGPMGPTGASGLREVADPNFPISQRKEAQRERKIRGGNSNERRKRSNKR